MSDLGTIVDAISLEACLDHLPLGACILAADGTILAWNRVLAEWSGLGFNDVRGGNAAVVKVMSSVRFVPRSLNAVTPKKYRVFGSRSDNAMPPRASPPIIIKPIPIAVNSQLE